MYFITFTCCDWISLFQLTNGYDIVYKWFDYLRANGHYINGYVIMPNHIHGLIAFRNTGKTINSIVSNGKRFMAYEIVNRLTKASEDQILLKLANAVKESDKKRGKLHQVFQPSFDCKECINEYFIEQKLTYIHNNPCAGKWQLATSPAKYQHSSALFYITGDQGVYPVTSYSIIQDIDLTK